MPGPRPRPILTAAAMRAAEAGHDPATLMARAGAGLAHAVHGFTAGAPALVLAGPGNNGGDGLIAATLLRARGVAVRVAAPDPSRVADHWTGPVEPLADAAPAPVLVDALFGTGLARSLADDIATPLVRLAAAARARIAVDLPSGVGADDGALLGPVPRFDLTVAFGALKPAHRLQPAASLCGRIVLVDIGVDTSGDLTEIAAPARRVPGADAHKYSRGMVAVVAGAMPGAAALAAEAAARGGAGYVLMLGGEGQGGPHAIVRRAWDDAALDDPRIGALLVGPGLGRDARARERLDAALAARRPMVLDGDALRLVGLPRLKRLDRPVLTPHEGEFARLFGDLPGSKVDRARAAAARSGAIVLLKGADSVVAAPDGRAALLPPAPGWLATAGTGDVLAGVVAARLAVGDDPFDAACAAAWLHAEAARRAGPGLIADDLLGHLA